MLKQNRVDGLLKHMEDLGLEQCLIHNPLIIDYLIGIKPGSKDRATILYVSKNNGVKIINNILNTLPEVDVEKVIHKDGDDVAEEIAKVTLNDKPLGIDGEYPAKWLIPLAKAHAGSDFVIIDNAIKYQRADKDEEEKDLMRKASLMNDSLMKKVRTLFYDGITEKEASSKISQMFLAEGADCPGWVIVAFGENSANVHHMPGDRKLKEGDAILVDMGSAKNKYQSDMTRTFFWKSVSDYQRKVYEIVKNANLLAQEKMHAGMKACELDAVARDYITSQGFGEYFTHRLGHYIGLEVHDPGDVSWYSTDELKENYSFSDEPGIYLPGKFGVRIEDLVILTKNGCEVLNSDSKELEVLGL